MKHIVLVFLIAILSIPLSAQESEPRKWGIETDILWPIFPGATRTHLTYTLWNKGGLRGDIYIG
ncbi:MAG: hypothetical protein ACK54P_12325, partial [Bacteroidota bacterium]